MASAGGNAPSASWLDRTVNGGRTWSIQPNFEQGYLAFNSATDGWLYGGSLYKTTDRGLTWHRVHIAGILGSAGSVVTDGRYTWVDEQPKSTTKSNLDCPPTMLLRSTSFGANPALITVQPSLRGSCSTQFVAQQGSARTSCSSIELVQLDSPQPTTGEFLGVSDSALRRISRSRELVVAGLELPYGQVLDTSGYRRVHIFQSADGGTTWSQIRPINGGFVNENGPLVGSFVQSSSLVAWS